MKNKIELKTGYLISLKMDLDSMKYSELQSLAKELGLKANMKASKLLKAIKQHQEKENKHEKKDVQKEEEVVEEDLQDASKKDLFVQEGRGRRKTKKKAKVESDANMSQDDVEMNTTFDASPNKRKMSLLEEPETFREDAISTKNEEPIDSKDGPRASREKENSTKIPKAGKIPRYQRRPEKSKTLMKPITPNFKKLHEAQFSKMESIDSYMQRKTQKKESYKKTQREPKLPEKAKPQQPDAKAQVKKKSTRATMFSPAQGNPKKNEEKRRNTEVLFSKTGKKEVAFTPVVFSTHKINFKFSKNTPDNVSKGSKKPAARVTMCLDTHTPRRQTGQTELMLFSKNSRTSVTPGTQKKQSFDLKASLSRPLTYKPHKGKLKPFGDTPSNVQNPRQEGYKQHKVQTREDRRTKQMKDRKEKKESLLGARRGLVMM